MSLIIAATSMILYPSVSSYFRTYTIRNIFVMLVLSDLLFSWATIQTDWIGHVFVHDGEVMVPHFLTFFTHFNLYFFILPCAFNCLGSWNQGVEKSGFQFCSLNPSNLLLFYDQDYMTTIPSHLNNWMFCVWIEHTPVIDIALLNAD